MRTVDGGQGTHSRRMGATATRTEGESHVQCWALGNEGSGHGCRKIGGRKEAFTWPRVPASSESQRWACRPGQSERILAPTHSFPCSGDRAEALGVLSLLTAGEKGLSTAGHRDLQIYSLATAGHITTGPGPAPTCLTDPHQTGFASHEGWVIAVDF